jgi:hypothetical protein
MTTAAAALLLPAECVLELMKTMIHSDLTVCFLQVQMGRRKFPALSFPSSWPEYVGRKI